MREAGLRPTAGVKFQCLAPDQIGGGAGMVAVLARSMLGIGEAAIGC